MIYFLKLCIPLLHVVFLFLFLSFSNYAHASLCGNCSSSCGGDGPDTTYAQAAYAPPPPPPSCTLSAPAQIEEGIASIVLKWDKTPSGDVALSRMERPNGLFGIISRIAAPAKTFRDFSVATLAEGLYRYKVEYRHTYNKFFPATCQGNNQDGCGYPANTDRWVPTDITLNCVADVEVVSKVVRPNLVASIDPIDPIATGQSVSVNGHVTNDADVSIPTLSSRQIRWRKVGMSDYTYLRNALSTYAPHEKKARQGSFTPATAGNYQVCMIADSEDDVEETNEQDNIACTNVLVAPDTDVSVDLQIKNLTMGTGWMDDTIVIRSSDQVALRWESSGATSCASDGGGFSTGGLTDSQTNSVTEPVGAGNIRTYKIECKNALGETDTDRVSARILTDTSVSVSLKADPTLVRHNETSELTWDTGSRNACTLTGDGEFVSLGTRVQGSMTSGPLTGETIYTLLCPDGATDSAVIKVLPKESET